MTSSSRTPGRRSFLAGAAALGGAGLVPRPAAGFVPAHKSGPSPERQVLERELKKTKARLVELEKRVTE
jgi:hypothetical protein